MEYLHLKVHGSTLYVDIDTKKINASNQISEYGSYAEHVY